MLTARTSTLWLPAKARSVSATCTFLDVNFGMHLVQLALNGYRSGYRGEVTTPRDLLKFPPQSMWYNNNSTVSANSCCLSNILSHEQHHSYFLYDWLTLELYVEYEYDISIRQLRTLFTYWCHICCLRFRRDNLIVDGRRWYPWGALYLMYMASFTFTSFILLLYVISRY